MTEVLILIFDLVGTIAFAISGALVGVGKRMDLFGTIVLAVCTATGGGVLRDLMVGNIPPYMFRNPLFVGIAALVALVVFFLVYLHTKMPKILSTVYDKMLFWFDTLGLAAFTVDGVMVGIRKGYEDNVFLLVFLGFLTAVGGGTLRDVLELPASMVYVIDCGGAEVLVPAVPPFHQGVDLEGRVLTIRTIEGMLPHEN